MRVTRSYVLVAGICALALGVAAILTRSDVPSGAPGAPPARADVDGAAVAAGTYGFSHQVTSIVDGQTLVTMAEGPPGAQTRCQRVDLPCSYVELKALDQSGTPIPPDLHMTRDELHALVDQLDAVAKGLDKYKDINQACRDGYRLQSPQVGNMGFHMSSRAFNMDGQFDLARPEILLYARPGGEQRSMQEIGDCIDGAWTGQPGEQVVGAAFYLDTNRFGDAHPEGFAGPLDNWHVHYHVCVTGVSAAALTKEACEKRGGMYLDKAGWMIHTYVVPEFDSQLGVFSIWNGSIWPKSDVNAMASHSHHMMGKESLIFQFQFEPIQILAGESVTFRNADPVFHSVTAGTPGAAAPAFDSGRLFSDQTFTVKLDTPGAYTFYCRYHPNMTGTIVVK